MFHYTERAASTGEPPTPPETVVGQETLELASSSSSSNVIAIEGHSNRSSISISLSSSTPSTGRPIQEADSGYEASPSSIAGGNSCTFSFEEHQMEENNIDNSDPADFPVVMHFEMDVEADEPLVNEVEREEAAERSTQDCPRCGPTCLCFLCLNSDSDLPQGPDEPRDGHSEARSVPIPIPLRRSIANGDYVHQFTNNLTVCSPQTRSSPLQNFQRMEEVRQRAERGEAMPFSWPGVSVVMGGSRSMYWPQFNGWDSTRNAATQTTARSRRRRRSIGSDGSLTSSDGGETAGHEEEEENSPSLPSNGFHYFLRPNIRRPQPLPDLVQSHGTRRGRSVSVNFPLESEHEDAIVELGRTLRRLSDEFQHRREFPNRGGTQNRRRSIADVFEYFRSRIPIPTSDHHSDDDDDTFEEVDAGGANDHSLHK